MDKIATTTELQSELRRLIADAQEPRPSRIALARKLARLSARVGMTFDSKKELDRYLKEHPNADRSNHSVKKNGPQQSASPFADQKAYRAFGKASLESDKFVAKINQLQERAGKRSVSESKPLLEKANKVYREQAEHAEQLSKDIQSHLEAVSDVEFTHPAQGHSVDTILNAKRDLDDAIAKGKKLGDHTFMSQLGDASSDLHAATQRAAALMLAFTRHG